MAEKNTWQRSNLEVVWFTKQLCWVIYIAFAQISILRRRGQLNENVSFEMPLIICYNDPVDKLYVVRQVLQYHVVCPYEHMFWWVPEWVVFP